ncbi:DUF1192 domain-containing protein [Varunaivibrio sulfuroxidans]|nr:DUF1192 domain-containing protein [Varunaivibrio sulfuroxidans]WES31810.1 DUF1192 domain-containing protein [Varunaivibrio sulfuroxidans]
MHGLARWGIPFLASKFNKFWAQKKKALDALRLPAVHNVRMNGDARDGAALSRLCENPAKGDKRDAMMDEEEQTSRRGRPPQKNLDEMSIEALQGYLLELKEEIERVTKVIDDKVQARSGAEAFFKN